MPQIINTNILSLTAQRNLNSTQNDLATSVQRLSSGLRINSAKDDAAGLAISERFTAQIRGLNQAVRNANDGISYSQTAEGALDTVGDSLQRIRELAVESANDTNSSTDRQALNEEVQQLIAEINRVANETQFNGTNVLDGSASTTVFQVGANQNQTIAVNGVDARGSQLGAATDTGTVILDSAISGGVTDITLNGITVDLSSASTVTDVVDAINNEAANTNVRALRATTVDTGALTYAAPAAGNGAITINGVAIALTDGNTVAQSVTQINNFSTQTGVTAAVNGADIQFTNTDGSDIVVVDANSLIGGSDTYQAGIALATDVGQTITVGGTDAAALGIDAISVTDNTVNGVDVLNRSNSNDALLTLDFALQQVNSLRSELGAIQNRFESTISNLQTTAENLSAARARIRDADFAAETAKFTRSQILQQAGVAMVAQANALPQSVLGLLG
jgi:flagellin